ncbi:hypothetical protein P3S67_018159 [Capsicum chacoense]
MWVVVGFQLVKTSGEASHVPVAPFAGHSLIPWQGNKLISIGGRTKDPSETMQGSRGLHLGYRRVKLYIANVLSR